MRRETNEEAARRLIKAALAGQCDGALCIAYGRVSSKQQERDGTSLDGQRVDGEEYAADHGLILHA